MKQKKYSKGMGWFNDSERHRLARLGIKTAFAKKKVKIGSDLYDFPSSEYTYRKMTEADAMDRNMKRINMAKFVNEYSDLIDDESLKLFLKENGLDIEDIEDISQEEDGILFIQSHGQEYKIFDDEDKAEEYAKDRVRQDLENEPEMFDKDWLQQHISFSETDINMMSSEQGDSYANDIRDEDDGKRVCEEADVLDEYEEIQEKIDDEEDDDKLQELESKKEEIIDEAVETVSESIADDWRQGLERDPHDFLVNEQGIYTSEDFFKHFGYSIDIDDAVDDAIAVDGWQHFVASYDGNSTELPDGKVIVRIN